MIHDDDDIEYFDPDNDTLEFISTLIANMKLRKPNDRTERDRYHAIAITEAEKLYAIFKTYCMKGDEG